MRTIYKRRRAPQPRNPELEGEQERKTRERLYPPPTQVEVVSGRDATVAG